MRQGVPFELPQLVDDHFFLYHDFLDKCKCSITASSERLASILCMPVEGENDKAGIRVTVQPVTATPLLAIRP